MRIVAVLCVFAVSMAALDDNIPLPDRARQYLVDLLRLDTSNPPGNETRVVEYMKQVADAHAIANELAGPDPRRLNFIARLKGNGRRRPLLLMAHSDVIPADRAQWSFEPFRPEIREGVITGRGAVDAKSLLAAELAVLVELKRRNIRLDRDIILLSEADEESTNSGMQWLVDRAWPKIDAEVALNESGFITVGPNQDRIFLVQVAEKVPMRVILSARGTPAHASLPRADNPVLRVARAITRLADAEQPVRLNAVTRRYFREIAKLPEYAWLQPLVPQLENPALAAGAANKIRARDTELDALLRTSVAPTLLRGGSKVNVIPSAAEAQLDVRRLPGETREEIVARFRQIVNDTTVEVTAAANPAMPATEPSTVASPAYRAMEHVLKSHPEDLVLPFMSRGATDGSYLRARGVAVYGVPLFAREGGENRVHGNDERISIKNLDDGVELLWQIVMEIAGPQ